MVDYKYADLFYRENTDKQAKIGYSGGIMTNTELFQNSEVLTESLCSEKELRFGCCEAASFKFKVANIVKPMAGETVTFSIVVDHHEADPFLVGRYKVASDKETADRRYREIVAYDVMYDILNTDMTAWYNSILPEESSAVTLRQFRTGFIKHFGLESVLPEGGLVNDGMTVERTINPEQISGKDIITAICEINGCFGHIGRDGKFHYIYLTQAIEGLYPANDLYPDHAPEWMVQAKTGHLYPQSPQSVRLGTGRYIKCQYEDYVTRRITRLQIRQEENDIGKTWPEGEIKPSDNCYIIQDNFLVYGKSEEQLSAIAENIFGKITDIVYRPFNADCVGNPCMEVGDPVRFPTKYEIVESYILKRTMKGIQALRDTYAADGAEQYAEKLNGVQKSIVQLKGKSNVLTRTIEETRLEMKDMGEGLSNTIAVTAGEIRGELKNEVDGLSNTISSTAGEIRTELQDTKKGLETAISATAEGIRADVSKTYETKTDASAEYTSIRSSLSVESDRISSEIERSKTVEKELDGKITSTSTTLSSQIEQTEKSIRSDVSENYETKDGAKTQYDSLSSSINQTSSEISAEVTRATAAEGNLSSQLQLLGGQVVLKADANGRMVQVALNANPATGAEFKVDADNITLSANDVINILAGKTLNLSAANINLTANNWSVDSEGNMVCNSLSAVTFTGRAINDLNDAIWNSATMQRVNEIIAIFDGKIGNIEQLLYNNKILFDLLDGKQDAYSWYSATLEEGATIIDGNWLKAPAGGSLASFTAIDATGYNKIVCRINGYANGTVTGPNVANHFSLRVGATNNPDAATEVIHKSDQGGGNIYSGAALNTWFDLTIDVSGFTSKTAIPINVFCSRQASPSSWRLYCSKITLTNQ